MRSLPWSGWARVCAAALCLALPGSAMLGGQVRAATTLEERKLPMAFTWHDAPPSCQGKTIDDCAGWIGAVGIITSDTPTAFEEFIKDRAMKGVTVVLDSAGGSVLDAIKLGRRWRGLGLRTTVGIVVQRDSTSGPHRDIIPDAYCESMCVFLLLAGSHRDVPDGAHVRVHQIWMGDRADNARAATYSAEDLMIVERDIGRLAKFTFDMGGSGDLLSLALSVPPWESLHELTPDELRLTNLVPARDVVAGAKDVPTAREVVGSVGPKVVQDRFAGGGLAGEKSASAGPSTKTAEAHAPTGGAATPK